MRLSTMHPVLFPVRTLIVPSRLATFKRGPYGMLDPKYNKAFVGIFGSEKNKSITKKFIMDVTGLAVEDLTTDVKRDFVIQNQNEAEGVVDVLCKTYTGEQFLIEIQNNYQRGFAKRMLYYGSRLYSKQLEEGDPANYPKTLKNVVIIAISNYKLMFENESYISHHLVLDSETKRNELEGLNFYFIDLKKFKIEREEVKLLRNATEAWCYYFKYIHELNDTDLSAFKDKYPDMEEAINELSKFSLSKEEWDQYTLFRMGQTNTSNSEEEYAEDYSKLMLRKVAKKMKERGHSIEEIIKCTGLEKKDFE